MILDFGQINDNIIQNWKLLVIRYTIKSIFLFTFPHFLAPKDTSPRKYFFAVIAFDPSNDIRGPPESPVHESLSKCIKSLN